MELLLVATMELFQHVLEILGRIAAVIQFACILALSKKYFSYYYSLLAS